MRRFDDWAHGDERAPLKEQAATSSTMRSLVKVKILIFECFVWAKRLEVQVRTLLEGIVIFPREMYKRRRGGASFLIDQKTNPHSVGHLKEPQFKKTRSRAKRGLVWVCLCLLQGRVGVGRKLQA